MTLKNINGIQLIRIILFIKDYTKNPIDFWALMNDLGVSYDKENKCWYTFYSNEKIDKSYFL